MILFSSKIKINKKKMHSDEKKTNWIKISEDKGNAIVVKINIKKEKMNKFIWIIYSYEDYMDIISIMIKKKA